jgi:pyruvate/2-oxoglutarate dehydrogenase complex dihydrolipoamide dehydrogenase (E3) component
MEDSPGEYDYDLIIIGSGAGGTAAAKEASKLGRRVAICDFIMPSSVVKSWGWRLGGSCVNTGCVPKMLMHQSGLVGEYLDKSSSLPFGWFAPEDEKAFSNDWTTLIDCIQCHIKSLNDKRQLLSDGYSENVRYFNAHCKFENAHSIQLVHEDKTTQIITGKVRIISSS